LKAFDGKMVSEKSHGDSLRMAEKAFNLTNARQDKKDRKQRMERDGNQDQVEPKEKKLCD